MDISHVAVSGAVRVSADGNSTADKQVCSLCGGQDKAFCASLGHGCLVLVVVGGAAFNGAGVALLGVLQAHHAVEELCNGSRSTRILGATGAPQSYARGMAGVVDGGQTGAARCLAANLTGIILRVGHICVDMAGTVLALAPLLETGGLVALHLEVLVSILAPLADEGILLKHPAQMFARTHIIQIVDMLDIEDFVAAVLLLFGGNFQTPELRKACKVIAARSRGGRRSADKAHAVIGQLTNGRGAGGVQRNGAAVDAVIFQHIAEPAFQHLHLGVLGGIVLCLPPLDKQAVHLSFAGGAGHQMLVAQVCRTGGRASSSSGPLDCVQLLQRGITREIDNGICHVLVLLNDEVQAAVSGIVDGLNLTVFNGDNAPVVFGRVCHQLLRGLIDIIGVVRIGGFGDLDRIRIRRGLGVNSILFHAASLPAQNTSSRV